MLCRHARCFARRNRCFANVTDGLQHITDTLQTAPDGLQNITDCLQALSKFGKFLYLQVRLLLREHFLNLIDIFIAASRKIADDRLRRRHFGRECSQISDRVRRFKRGNDAFGLRKNLKRF